MLRVLSNINLEPLKVELRPMEVSFAGYNQLERELLDSASSTYSEKVSEILVFLDGEALLGDRLHAMPDTDLVDEVIADVRAMLGLIEQFARTRKSVLVTINNVVLPPRTCITFLNTNHSLSFNDIEQKINEEVAALARRFSNIWVLDWRAVVLEHGLGSLTNNRFWYLARVKFTKEAFIALAGEYTRLRSAITSGPRKVLVLDLDNTLWGGAAGDAGLEGIQLSEDGIGKAYREFQAALKGLKRTGVLLAVVSKNDNHEIQAILNDHPMMALRTADFAAMRINWLSKPDNILDIARELRVDLDSMVFLDDNPVERDLVRVTLPVVSVPDFPADPTTLKSWLMADVAPAFFGRIRLTGEDLQKTEQYRANAARFELASSVTLKEYLSTLRIRLTVQINRKQSLSRVTQLIQKTNQFNLTGRRYTEAEVDSMYADPGRMVLTLEYEDKFGKEGIVAAAVLTCNKPTAAIETFVMSCRVIGRDVEYTFLQWIVESLCERGVTTISGEYVPTTRNAVAREFYRSAGLEPMSDHLYCGAVERVLKAIATGTVHYEVCEA